MPKKLTERQKEVLNVLENYIEEKGYVPSIRELGKMLGISSLRGVTIHLDALERKGWIRRESTSRSIKIIKDGAMPKQQPQMVPLIRAFTINSPLTAIENIESYVPIPNEMASDSSELFALKVKDDSMKGYAILEGDIIIIRRQDSADCGGIVAALIGNEVIIRKINFNNNITELKSSNPNYPPIQLTNENNQVIGKVIGLIRPMISEKNKGA